MGVGCFLLPVITLILILKSISYRRPLPIRGRPSGPALSIPPRGNARILARKLSESAQRIEWQWTLVGERNWPGADATDIGFKLSGAYPLNSRSTLGGTHIWVAGLTASHPSGSPPGKLRVDSSLHGSNGVTVTRSWDADSNKPLPDALEIIQHEDGMAGIPSDLRLATVAGRPFVLSINP
jgi:hypothetical protein